MTGTGTQTDPYIVMNVDEFLEAAVSETVFIKLGADINMDGIQNQQVQFAELDGDGHSFINMTTPPPYSNYWYMLNIANNPENSKIKNVKFPSALR